MLASFIVVICLFVDAGQSIRFLGEAETYARYSKWNACNNASITFEFRTRQKDGLLMHTRYQGANNYLQVGCVISNCLLCLCFIPWCIPVY